MILGGVCRLFSNLLPRPTHEELLTIETKPWADDLDVLACGGCVRLQRWHHFEYSLFERLFIGHQGCPKPEERLCEEGDGGELSGGSRYELSDQRSHYTEKQDKELVRHEMEQQLVRCCGWQELARSPQYFSFTGL